MIWYISWCDMAHTAMRKRPFGTQAVCGPLCDGRHTVAEKPFLLSAP